MPKMNKKKAFWDSVLNIAATAVPLLVLQLIALPIMGDQMGTDQYGLAVSIISLMTLFSHVFGNVLNNIRLITRDEYEDNRISGDFNVLLLISLPINTVIMVLGTWWLEGSFDFVNILFIILSGAGIILWEYLIVAFRLTLNYSKILLGNVALSIGYLAGLGLFLLTGYWQLVYLMGSVFSVAFVLCTTKLIREPYHRTKLFFSTTQKSIILTVASFFNTALNYVDKLILFPLLGGAVVSVYYSATIFGKVISTGIQPISSVMLSYFSRLKSFRKENFWLLFFISTAIGVIGYVICIVCSGPVLDMLYPQWAEESMKYIYITTATAIVGMVSSVMNPVILKFCSLNWQVAINGINFVVYIVVTLIFLSIWGLYGFCIGILIANLVKLFLIILVYIRNGSTVGA